MVNRRGWLRILEAVIAALIVFSTLLFVISTNKARQESDICGALAPLLNEIGKNTTLREQIMQERTDGVLAFLATQITNPALAYRVKICSPEPQVLCLLEESGLEKTEVCADERIISSTTATFNPKRLKLFLFKKS